MEDIVNDNEQFIEINNNLFIKKTIIDLENGMASLMLFLNCRCDVIADEVVSTVNNQYVKDTKLPSDKEMIEQTIKGFFLGYKNEVERIIKEKTELLRDTIDIEQEEYNEKLQSSVLEICNEVSRYYSTQVSELVNVILTIDSTQTDSIWNYFLQIVGEKLIKLLDTQLRCYIRTINNNQSANISYLETINEKTVKAA